MQDDRPPGDLVADPEMHGAVSRPPARRAGGAWQALLVLAAVAALGLWRLGWLAPADAPPTPAAVPAAASASAAAATASAAVAAAPAPPASAAGLPALDESDLVFARWLEALFGREGMALLRIQDLARHVVATVDNLGREHAPTRLWPVHPAAGRFSTVEHNGRSLIDPDNQLRYAPLVILLESAEPARVVALYHDAYPLLQQAYAELGYPGQSFHARLLVVIDMLLATPEATDQTEVLPVAVQGGAALSQSWRFHRFADPMLEQLSAGQKLLLRMGPVNQRRLKLVLQRLRAALLAPAPTR